MIGRHEIVASRLNEAHRVGAGDQPREVVETIGIGGGGGDHLAQCVFQLHGDIGQAHIARALHGVAVDVHPNPVAQGGVLVEA